MDAEQTQTQMTLAALTAEYERGIWLHRVAVAARTAARRAARGVARLLKQAA